MEIRDVSGSEGEEWRVDFCQVCENTEANPRGATSGCEELRVGHGLAVEIGSRRQVSGQRLANIRCEEGSWQAAHGGGEADFDKHGYTDQCPRFSVIPNGLHVQSHTRECLQRLEGVLASDVGMRNARIWMQQRSAKFNADNEEPGCAAKRRKHDDIENQAMVEEDWEKLAKLFEEYWEECLKAQGADR